MTPALGDILLWIAAIALAIALFLYGLIVAGKPVSHRSAGWIYTISALALAGASIVLWQLLFTHRFEVAYVYGYTSSDLPAGYLFSAFWAGPEGSFLFWALAGSWAGVVLLRRTKDLQAPAMLFWCLAQGLLMVMLLSRTPFGLLDGSPADGQGLNPILQDPWMAIHPPILFVGFVMMTVPACLGAGSLLVGRFGRWSVEALPWASLGWLSLGAGIALGGLWAYETLGWGGYWGWDPVENSSLIPWITGTILLHGLIVEKRRNTSQRPNYIFALLTYLLVLYSTFLTRSGVLGDFSVHSFSDLGVTQVLAGLIVVFVLLFAILVIWRFRTVPAPSIVEGPDGKEVNHYVTSWVLAGIAFLILLGTSMPLLTRLINPESPSGVQPGFYNRTTLPLALALLALVALSPAMPWSARGKAREARASRPRWFGLAVVLGLACVLLAMIVWGAALGSQLTLGALGLVAFSVNLAFFVRTTLAQGTLSASAFLAHAGLGLMFIGISGSTLGGSEQRIDIEEGGKASAKGWTAELREVTANEQGHIAADLRLADPGGRTRQATITGKPMGPEQYVYRPFIHRGLFADVYFAPLQIVPRMDADAHTHDHTAEEEPVTARLANSEKLSPKFIVGEGGTRSQADSTREGSITITVKRIAVEQRSVDLEVKAGQTAPRQVTLQQGAVKRLGRWDLQFEGFGGMEAAEDGSTQVSILVNAAPATGSKPEMEQTDLEPADANPHEVVDSPEAGYIALQVSRKPLMSLLWLGAAITGIGSLMAVIRRFSEPSS